MTNIFENAKFGDKFRTRDGRMAIYNGRFMYDFFLIVERHPYNVLKFNINGRHSGITEPVDIVGKWQEPINEEELDILAEEYFVNTYNNGKVNNALDIINEKEFAVEDFKAGYRKAKQE